MDDTFDKCTSVPITKFIIYKSNGKHYTLSVKYGTYTHDNIKYVTYDMRTDQVTIEELHPFQMLEESEIEHENNMMSTGNICADNIVTQSLLQMITMDNVELASHSGITDPLHYRALLINSLGTLWD